MNVLWLNTGLLLPLDKGGRLRTWHLMRHLAQRHHITYLARCPTPSRSTVPLRTGGGCRTCFARGGST